MNVYTTDRIRNVVLLGHGGCGKTSLVEAMAYLSGMTTRMGKISDGNTISDYDWSSIQAVKDQQVYKMPLGAYRTFTPGADTPMTLLWVAKQVYPELFGEEDLTARTIAYYQDVFGVTLTEKQATGIYPETRQEQE